MFVCVPHTFLFQYNASSCNVYFMLCWPLLHVNPQLPSNIHTAEAHLHIKGPCSAKSSWSKYLSFVVLLSLSPYVSCLSPAFQLPATPPPSSHAHSLFHTVCSNPLLLKASLSFFLRPLLILSFIVIKLWEKQRTAHAVLLDRQKPCG